MGSVGALVSRMRCSASVGTGFNTIWAGECASGAPLIRDRSIPELGTIPGLQRIISQRRLRKLVCAAHAALRPGNALTWRLREWEARIGSMPRLPPAARSRGSDAEIAFEHRAVREQV